MLLCGRWGMTISGNSCWIFHVFARVTARATLLVSFRCELWRIFQLFSWYFCNRIQMAAILMRGKALENGWRMYPGLSYTPLMKLQKDAFHFRQCQKKKGFRRWRPGTELVFESWDATSCFLFLMYFFYYAIKMNCLQHWKLINNYRCLLYLQEAIFGFACQSIQNGFKCF